MSRSEVAEVKNFGNLVDASRLRPKKSTVAAVSLMPKPHSLTQLKSFHGMTKHKRQFISKNAY